MIGVGTEACFLFGVDAPVPGPGEVAPQFTLGGLTGGVLDFVFGRKLLAGE